MALQCHVALVSDGAGLGMPDLLAVAAVLGIQIQRDVVPLWGDQVAATVDAFADLNHVPPGYWPIIIRPDIQMPGADGVHEDTSGQPFSLIQMSPDWSLTCSHEAIEMICDPFGRRQAAAPSLAPDQQGEQVLYLLEPADPCERKEDAYQINGIWVSNFVTPDWYTAPDGKQGKYSFLGDITAPRTVKSGGYVSWERPKDGHWYQETYFGPAPSYVGLGRLTGTGSLRAQIDRLTKVPPEIIYGPAGTDQTVRATHRAGQQRSRVAQWRDAIERLAGRGPAAQPEPATEPAAEPPTAS